MGMDNCEQYDDDSCEGSFVLEVTLNDDVEELEENEEIDDDADFLSHHQSEHSLTYPPCQEDDDGVPESVASKNNKSLSDLTVIISRSKKSSSRAPYRSRTRARRTGDKNWGNASVPVISIKDIMGSEIKATQVGMTGSAHGRSGQQASKTGAQQKRSYIRSRHVQKKNRQNEVKSSLASFLPAKGGEDDSLTEDEDESLVSDDEHLKGDVDGHHDASTEEDDRSVKSTKSHSRRRRRMTPRLPEDDRNNSNHSRRQGSSKSRRTRQPPRRQALDNKSTDDEPEHGSRRRTFSGVDGGELQASRRRYPVDDDDRSIHSEKRRTSRRRNTSNHADDGSDRHSSRRRHQPDDDDRSVGSRKSVGRRRRTRGDHGGSGSGSGSRSQRHASKSPARHVQSKDGKRIPLPKSPSKTRNPARSNRLAPLARDSKRKSDRYGEEKSEELSRGSGGIQSTLLQFDPTNVDNFTVVNQTKANVTSEKMKNADGTESELQISELAGLPTFEVPPDSVDSVFSVDAMPGYHNSVGTIDFDPEVAEKEAKRSTRSLEGVGTAKGQQEGERSSEEDDGPTCGRGVKNCHSSGPRLRGISASRSLLSRIRRTKQEDNMTAEEGNASQLMHFTGWMKKDRDDDGMGHQALEDNGSDED